MTASNPRPNGNTPHLLVATDRSPGCLPSVAFAVALGNALGARVTLYHGVRTRHSIVQTALTPGGSPAPESVDEARRRLLDLAKPQASDRPVQVDVDDAHNALDAETAILAAADRIEPDFIVVPTHGRTGLQRAVLGSTAEQVLRQSTRPVLLLTERMLARTRQQAAPRGPVVVATDLSPAGSLAHRPAAELAHRLGLPLRLLSVLPVHQACAIGVATAADDPGSDAKTRIDHRVQELLAVAREFGPDVRAEVEARIEADVAGTIVQVANENHASLLVLTTHGRRGITRMLEGSVAEQVVRHATVPVLVMPVPWP